MRFFLLPFLLFSFVFACDFPYEEVRGYKIGCPYNVEQGVMEKNSDDKRVKKYIKFFDEEFFNAVIITTIDGNISSLQFVKIYDELSQYIENSKQDYSLVIDSLSKKWGEFDTIRRGYYVFSSRKFDEGVLGSITILFDTVDRPGIGVTYESMTAIKYEKEIEEIRKREIENKLKAF